MDDASALRAALLFGGLALPVLAFLIMGLLGVFNPDPCDHSLSTAFQDAHTRLTKLDLAEITDHFKVGFGMGSRVSRAAERDFRQWLAEAAVFGPTEPDQLVRDYARMLARFPHTLRQAAQAVGFPHGLPPDVVAALTQPAS